MLHPSREKLVVGNWKMNLTLSGGMDLLRGLVSQIRLRDDVKCVVCPPFIHLGASAEFIRPQPGYATGADRTTGSGLLLGAQNCHAEPAGAFTGEVSASMLASIPVQYVITGHSERRNLMGETDEIIRVKLQAVLTAGLTPILCCGESSADRKAGNHFSVVDRQLAACLSELTVQQAEGVIIAYEPVWAIGTGEVATPGQAKEMHAHIRRWLNDRFGTATAEHIPLLYGGSISPENAAELFVQPEIDGGLVGGASLRPESFAAIYEAMPR